MPMRFKNKRLIAAIEHVRSLYNNNSPAGVFSSAKPRNNETLSKNTPNLILDLGKDVVEIVGSYCHPLDLARLSLCCRDLLREAEECAQSLSKRLLQGAQSPTLNNIQGSNVSRSWRYQYLMVVEVSMAQDEALKAALAHIYQTDSTDKLNLYGLDIGDVGAAHLALALRVSPSHRVDSLNLCRNSISDHGASLLADALSSCQSELGTLSLAQNRIGADGARAIARLIRRSPCLRNLSLSDNPLTDEGVKVIACAMQQGCSLATLSMRAVSVSVNVREDLRGVWGTSRKSAIWGLYL